MQGGEGGGAVSQDFKGGEQAQLRGQRACDPAVAAHVSAAGGASNSTQAQPSLVCVTEYPLWFLTPFQRGCTAVKGGAARYA